MPYARREFTVVDEHGNLVTDASIEVRQEIAGAPLAVLYSDRDGTTPLGNPFSVDSETAVAAFHVAGGAYKVRAYKTGFERIERYVAIGTAAETDAGLIPTSISTGWTFDDATADADPGSGLFRLNNATPSSATEIYLDNENVGGNDVSAWLDSLDDAGDTSARGQLTICDPDQPTEVFRIYTVSGSVVDGTGYRKLTVAHVAGAGSFTAGTQYSFSFSARGVSTPASAVSYAGGTGLSATDVEAALDELDTEKANAGDLTAHINDTTAAHAASAISYNGGTGISATDVEGAIDELAAEKQDAATALTQGTHSIWVPATAMYGRTTNGAASGTSERTTNKNMFRTLDFDASTQEFAQFAIRMPKSWDEGTVTFAPVWSHPSTVTNFGVVWAMAGVAISNDDAGDVAFGTSQTSTDTGGTTDDIYEGPTSSEITIAGTPQAGDYVMFQMARNVADGNDTMAVDARLHGIMLFMTINAADDT